MYIVVWGTGWDICTEHASGDFCDNDNLASRRYAYKTRDEAELAVRKCERDHPLVIHRIYYVREVKRQQR